MYQVKFLYRNQEATAQGKTEQEAIDRLLSDNHTMRTAINNFDIALVMYQIIGETPHVTYATTYGKYLLDTE